MVNDDGQLLICVYVALRQPLRTHLMYFILSTRSQQLYNSRRSEVKREPSKWGNDVLSSSYFSPPPLLDSSFFPHILAAFPYLSQPSLPSSFNDRTFSDFNQFAMLLTAFTSVLFALGTTAAIPHKKRDSYAGQTIYVYGTGISALPVVTDSSGTTSFLLTPLNAFKAHSI